jgi:hypothetical protein
MLVGEDPSIAALAEAVLAKLHFAVTTSRVEEAARVVAALKPEIVVAAPGDADGIRQDAGHSVLLLELAGEMRQDPHKLIDAIRETLRVDTSDPPA